MTKPSAAPASYSSPEYPEKADSLTADGDDHDGDKRLGEDQGESEQEEEEVVEEEVEEEEEEEEEQEEEEEEEGEGVEGEMEVEGNDSSNENDDDISKKHEGHKELKSVYSNPESSYINSTNSHVKDVRGDNLDNNPQSNSCNKIASEISDGEASQHTPQKRPRSSSPGTEHESVNKNAPVICSFFARGWCIKGSSCKFLHKKEGVGCTSKAAKEDGATTGVSVDCKGSPGKVEKSTVTPSIDSIGILHADDSRKSGFVLERALVQTYGADICGLSQTTKDDNLLSSKNSSKEHFQIEVSCGSRTSYLAIDELRQKTSFQEENRRNDRHSTGGELLSRQYSNEGKIYKEMPIGESWNDVSFSRASPFTENLLTSKHNYLSGGSSAATNIYRDRISTYSDEKRPDSLAIRYQQSHFPLNDSYNARLCSSVDSSFDNSLRSFQDSPSIESLHSFAQAGTRLTYGSPPLVAVHAEIRKTFNYTRGIDGATLAFSEQKSKLEENTWEPSIPFRSSFCWTPATKSSSESQYDPLVDSIEPPKVRILNSASPRGIVDSMSSQLLVGDPILGGDIASGCNAKKSLNSSAYEGILGNRKSLHEYCGYTNAIASPGLTTVDGGSNITSKEENSRVPHLTDVAHVNEANLGGTTREVDKGKDTKESKLVKIFRSALVDFVKELLKPAWKKGHLSKDAHKTIVKKAVEKVLSALQPHQIPGDTESINQYLSTSQPKLLKLVEGYVDKYSKS